MEYIKDGELILALIVNVDDFPEGIKFWGDSDSPLQFGSCVYDKGKVLLPHIHKVRDRIPAHKTIEGLYIIAGMIKVDFYSLEKKLIQSRRLIEGDCVMLYDGGHSFTILKDDTIFIEIKNGPFVSVEADKERFEIEG